MGNEEVYELGRKGQGKASNDNEEIVLLFLFPVSNMCNDDTIFICSCPLCPQTLIFTFSGQNFQKTFCCIYFLRPKISKIHIAVSKDFNLQAITMHVHVFKRSTIHFSLFNLIH